MGQAVGEVLTQAVGVALSPMPIVAAILMLFTPKARANASAFAAGWVVGIVVLVGIVVAVANPAGVASDDGESSTLGAVLHLALGSGLILLALREWKSRPTGDAEPETPKWMQSIDGFSPVMAFGFGAFMSAINPKNLLLNVAAAQSIAQAGLSVGEEVVTIALFTIVASVSVAGVVVWALVGGSGVSARLDAMKTWLIGHNAVVMMVLLFFLGVSQIGTGIGML